MYELIITEKPNASKKIADALADGKPTKKSVNRVPYYELEHNGKEIVVACAVGHLYGLTEKEKKKGFAYPTFEIKWVPTSEMSKGAEFSKKYLDILKKLSKNANKFTVATDYDIEGEVIGLNIIRFACKQKDARRMKFSTLTKPDLVNAYEHANDHLDWGQAEAGETRHKLDWLYGINLSRALTSAIKKSGMFKILSAGRVQGPALKIVTDREKEIKAFIPVPFWQIELDGKTATEKIIAWHKEDKFWEKEKADSVMKKVKEEKKAKVDNVERKQFNQNPPVPFDLTSMQIEAHRCHRISPKETLSIAQDLYTAGLISYPRTSSQVLPVEIGFKKILASLGRQKDYKELASKVLNGKMVPNNGKKTDPAHPAIYPTGITPEIDGRKAKIYDLIVRRFLATFGEHAVRETMTIDINVKDEIFITKGTRTIEKGWHEYYGPYVKIEEIELPAVKKDETINIKKINMHNKETLPPKRYTEASIIKELEKRGLGTKATRAQIVDTLVQRSYITGKQIEATELGMQIIKILEEHSPKIVDEALTNLFEKEMDEIRDGSKKEEQILEKAKEVLTKILGEFKEKEDKIGAGLKKTFTETRAVMTTVGKCRNCEEGMLILRKGKFGRFIACDKYPDCKTTFKLPAGGLVKVTDNLCKECGYPMVLMIKKAKRPQEVCINTDCPLKDVKVKIEEKECPKCHKGRIILRKSVYGAFLACNQYPKCRYTESLPEEGDSKDKKDSKDKQDSKDKKPAKSKKAKKSVKKSK